MTLFKRGVLLLLLAALLLPPSIAFSQVPVPEASDPKLHADTFVPARAAAPAASCGAAGGSGAAVDGAGGLLRPSAG